MRTPRYASRRNLERKVAPYGTAAALPGAAGGRSHRFTIEEVGLPGATFAESRHVPLVQ